MKFPKGKILLILLILFVVAITILLFLLFSGLNFKTTREANFQVKSGQGILQIADNLKAKGLIDSPWVFTVYVRARGWVLQSGNYEIQKSLTTRQIAQMIHEGKVSESVVTIPEGWRASQIDEALAVKKIITKGEFLKVASLDEGYLFPDTYHFPKNITASAIREVMRKNFEEKTAKLNLTKDAVILASIVEREAVNDSDRAKIAGVYTNRLKIGMKLDADPTIQYAKGNWEPLVRADYQNTKSSYNTYLNRGLPPTPISNPGLKSIEAALNPEKNDYLYFFHTKDGKAIFSKTFEEHQANLVKYQ